MEKFNENQVQKSIEDLKIDVVKLKIKCSISDLYLKILKDKSYSYNDIHIIDNVIKNILKVVDETKIETME